MRTGTISKPRVLVGAAALATGLMVGHADAGTLTIAGDSGGVAINGSSTPLAAQAIFEVNGSGNLVITLSNEATDAVGVPSDLLTGVFFNIEDGLGNLLPNLGLTKLSAVIPDFVARSGGATGTNTVLNPDQANSDGDGPSPQDGVEGVNSVGGEFAYRENPPLGGSLTDQRYGIAGSGYIGGGGYLFGGDDLDTPLSPDGPNYGIASAATLDGDGNMGVKGEPIVRNTVQYTLGNVPVGFDPMTQIKDVVFTYGTSYSQPQFCGVPVPNPPPTPDGGGGGAPFGVPEPVTGAMGIMALAALGAASGRGRR